MRKLLVVLFLLLNLDAQDEYNLGEGIQVASLPLYIGGYFSADYRKMDDETRYRMDDIAFLAYGSYKKISYMAELEYKGFYVHTKKDGQTTSETNKRLHVERLYMDYNIDENYRVRLGKYSSPIGYWNLLPVNVLRETTSSPISTKIIYAKFTTGLGITYSSYDNSEINVDVMLQHNKDLDDNYNNYKIDQHYGLGVNYEKDLYSYKINFGYFENKHSVVDEDKRYYYLASAKYEDEKYQFKGEFGSQYDSNFNKTTDYAFYLQGLYHLDEKHSLILRAEAYDNTLDDKKDEIGIFAYTYRPLYPVAIKGEYQLHSIEDERQFLFSFSVMF
jgi:hypothetical protein